MTALRKSVILISVLVCVLMLMTQIADAKQLKPVKTVKKVFQSAEVNSDNEIELTWKAQKGASLYLVYRAQVYKGRAYTRYKHIGTAYEARFVDDTAHRGISYRYIIQFGSKKQSYRAYSPVARICVVRPVFVTGKSGEVCYSDLKSVTLVTKIGAGQRPDGMYLYRKNANGKFEKIQTITYDEKDAKNGFRRTFVDENVEPGKQYTYMIRSFKGNDSKEIVSKGSTISLWTLRPSGVFGICWYPVDDLDKDIVVVKVDPAKYNYNFAAARGFCRAMLYDDKTGKFHSQNGKVARYSYDGTKWQKPGKDFAIKDKPVYLEVQGKGFSMKTVSELQITGVYNGKQGSIALRNYMKLYYLTMDMNIEFDGEAE